MDDCPHGVAFGSCGGEGAGGAGRRSEVGEQLELVRVQGTHRLPVCFWVLVEVGRVALVRDRRNDGWLEKITVSLNIPTFTETTTYENKFRNIAAIIPIFIISTSRQVYCYNNYVYKYLCTLMINKIRSSACRTRANLCFY